MFASKKIPSLFLISLKRRFSLNKRLSNDKRKQRTQHKWSEQEPEEEKLSVCWTGLPISQQFTVTYSRSMQQVSHYIKATATSEEVADVRFVHERSFSNCCRGFCLFSLKRQIRIHSTMGKLKKCHNPLRKEWDPAAAAPWVWHFEERSGWMVTIEPLIMP